MELTNALSLIVATFIFVVTPGPGIVAIISTTLFNGFTRGIAISFGLILGDMVYLLFAIFGLSILVSILDDFFIVVRIIGGAYFLYLGYSMIRNKTNKFTLQNNQIRSKKKIFLQGFFISLSNPKVILFYLGFLPVFVDLSVLHAKEIVISVVLIFCTLLSGALLYVYSVNRAKALIQDEKKLHKLNILSGSLMCLVGLYLIFGL